jgi:endonuclease-3 related protein
MSRQKLHQLRRELLTVHGIGPETADSILLYAFDKHVFVIDAYTKRFLTRHRIVSQEIDYHTLQDLFASKLTADVKMFNEYHALIVRLGKEFCRTRARCEQCPLNYLNDLKRYRYPNEF